MKILLFGKCGQVGFELAKSLGLLGKVVAYNRQEANLEDEDELISILNSEAPDIIVNAAAYTAVDQAETEEVLATQINTKAVGVLATFAKETDSLFVHFSTDYVFDGNKTEPYTEEDEVNPQSIYGKTKWRGEQLIKASECKHFIIRTSWVYSNRRKNFVRTILNLAANKQELSVIDDQIGVPTSAKLISKITCEMLSQYVENPARCQSKWGTYHLAPSGKTNWFEYAKTIVTIADQQDEDLTLSPNTICPISTAEFSQPAIRPKNSMLNTTKIRKVFGVELPNWEKELSQTIPSLLTCQS